MRENINYAIDESLVQIVTDENFYKQINDEIDCGTHALSITRETDGLVYVIFVFWGLIAYKIKIGYVGEIQILRPIRYDFFCIRYDGSTFNLHVPRLTEVCEISADVVEKSFDMVFNMLKNRFEQMFKENLISKNSLKRLVYKIETIINSTDDDSQKISRLLGIIDRMYGTALYILLILSENSEKYNFNDTFNNNLKCILNTNEKHYTSIPKLIAYFQKKNKEGTVLSELKKGINIFHKIYK